jgi:hypothetical protein
VPVISLSCFGIQGWAANARFDIVPTDLEAFLNSTLIQEPLSNTEPFSGFKVFDAAPTRYLYGKYQAGDLLQQVLVDIGNPERYTVYIEVLGG